MTVFSLSEAELRKRRSMKWRVYPADVLPLWVAEMDSLPPEPIARLISQLVATGDTGYPGGRVYAEAFQQLAAERWNWQVADDQIKQSGDVMNSILGVLQVLTEPGDAVVINPPIYPPFRTVTAGYGRKVVEAPCTTTGRIDLASLEVAFASPDKPKVYLMCSPHNPTGSVHTAAELTQVAALARQYNVRIVADEIHAPIVQPTAKFTPILTIAGAENAIAVTSAGKAWNLACFKGGLIIGGVESDDALRDIRPLLLQSMGHFASLTHATAMRECSGWVDEYLVEIRENQLLLAKLLAEYVPAAKYQPSEGTYLAWVDCSALGFSNPSAEFIHRAKVAFNDGAAFGAEYDQWIRINLATSPEIITQAVRRMATIVQ